jgi:hypothetical protein
MTPRLQAVHERAMRRFDHVWGVEKEDRAQSLRDRRFATVRGAQWQGQFAVGDEETAEEETGVPRMEVPKFLRQIKRAAGEYRSSRQSVDFRPKDGSSDRDSANNLDGLYRADMNDSVGGGQLAVDNAASEARLGGRGAWRYRAVYEDESDEENEQQRIRIERIDEADQSVFFDPDAKAQDKSDATHAFVLFDLTREAFEERYPKASESTFGGKLDWTYDWTRPDSITLAEYYEVEDRSVLRRTFRQVALDGIELPDDVEPDEQTFDDETLTAERDDGTTLEGDLRDQGYEEVRSRRIKRQRVRKYLLSGTEVLSDEGVIAGRYIPIVPLFHERQVVDGIERASGMVRPVIDSTRIYNLMVSGLAEASSGPQDDTPVAAPEQFAGLETIWAGRKVNRPAYLPLHPILNPNDGTIIQAGFSTTLPAAQVSPAMATLIQIAGADIAEMMGVNDRPETVPSNTSAQAIQLVNDEADVHDAEWKDNLSIALQHGGRIWLSMAQELYVEPGRKMTAVGEDGTKSAITLAEPVNDEGGQHFKNDLTRGAYDVIVDVGPATRTKRDATVRAMTGLGQVYAAAGNMDAANACLGIAVLNMDGEGIDGIQAWTRKQGLTAGWVEPNEQEKKALEGQPQQPDPTMVAAQAQVALAEAEGRKADAATIQAQARVMTAQADAAQAQAETAATLAGIDRDDRKQILAEVKAQADVDADEREQLAEAARMLTPRDA